MDINSIKSEADKLAAKGVKEAKRANWFVRGFFIFFAAMCVGAAILFAVGVL
jgi:hypothetical protein